MECKNFIHWLRNRDNRHAEEENEALAHALDCPDCAMLRRVDRKLEKTIRTGLGRVEAPAELKSNIALLARKKPKAQLFQHGWFLIPVAAAICLALLVLLRNPLPARLDSLEKIARLSEKVHMASVPMEFDAREVKNIPAWFQERGVSALAIPSFPGRHFNLQGGRVYRLGKIETAYLLYNADGKRYSFFALPTEKIPLQLVNNQLYRYPVNRCVIEVWKDAGRVYILVS